jgi:glycine oxidase
MSASHGDVVVIGAGLIGLAIAFELAERGASVRVYDRGEPARAASWAGAGMLAPYSESIGNAVLLELCAGSLREYPVFVERVRDASGIDPRLHLDGVLHAWFDEDRREEFVAPDAAAGVAAEVLDRAGVIALEPWLGAHVAGGVFVRGEGHVDNRRLGRALVTACKARGVTISQTSTIHIECDARRVRGVGTDLGFVAAASAINACGAWAAQLSGVPSACIPPVTPVKGQMLALAAPADFVRHATWLSGAYLVPREDGRLLVGATVEAAGFDERVTAGGLQRLLEAALTSAPALGSFAVTESWAGLRPGTPDGLPFLGPTAIDGLLLATGHYRNGILLAPITARLIADAVESGGAGELLQPFLLERANAEEAAARRISHA